MATQNVNIVIRTSGGTTVVRQLNSIATSANRAASMILRVHRVLLAVSAVIAIGKITQWADEWTAAANKIKVFAANQAESNEVLDRLYKIALKVGQPLNSIVDLYHKLSIQAKALGASTAENIQITETVNKALTIQGTSAATASGALLQLSQAFGTGRVKAQEYNSLLTGTPLLLKVIAENMEGVGGSVARLTAMQRAGKLSSQDLFQALLKSGKTIDELFGKMNRTFAQAFENFSTGFSKFFGEMNNGLGLSTKFYKLSILISENLNNIGKWLFIISAAVVGAFAPTLISAFATALTLAAGAMQRLAVMLLANPFIAILTAVAYVIAFGDSWLLGIDNITTVKDLFLAFIDTIVDGFSVAGDVIGGWWNSLISVVSEFYASASGMTKESVGGWFSSYTSFFDDVEGGFVGMARVAARTTDAIAGLITGAVIAIGRIFGGLPSVVATIFKQIYNEIVTTINSALNVVIDGINSIRRVVGLSLVQALKIEKLTVDKKVFQDYGRDIASAVDDGFAIQGGFMEKQLNGILAKATANAKKRIAQTSGGNETFDLNAKPDPLAPFEAGKKGGKGKPDRSDFERYDKMTKDRIALAKLELESVDKLSQAEKRRINLLQDIDSAKLTEPQKVMLRARAETIGLLEIEIEKREELRKVEEKARKEREAAAEVVKNYMLSQQGLIDGINFETSLLGKNAEAQQRMTMLRYMDLDAQRAIFDAKGDTSAIEKINKANEDAQARALAALDRQIAKQKELNASWEYGAKNALDAYLKQVQDVAGSAETAFSNAFKSLEDAGTELLTTGKLNINSFATSVVNDINRMIIKSAITGPLAAIINGGMSSGTGVGGLIGGFFNNMFGMSAGLPKANGGFASPNSFQRVNEKGPELLSVRGKDYLMMGDAGGTVTPNGGGNGPTTVQQYNTFNFDSPVDKRTQSQIGAVTLQAAQDAMRRNT